jgi:hypothetical protein
MAGGRYHRWVSGVVSSWYRIISVTVHYVALLSLLVWAFLMYHGSVVNFVSLLDVYALLNVSSSIVEPSLIHSESNC